MVESTNKRSKTYRKVRRIEKRDHRRLGKDLDLFSMHEEVVHVYLLHPQCRIRMAIEDFWRNEHIKNGYEMVYTPIFVILAFKQVGI